MTIIRSIRISRLGRVGFYGCRRWLPACSSLLSEFEQIPSQVWPHPEQTRLGELIAETAPADKSLSGVELLADPSGAFGTRFAIAVARIGGRCPYSILASD